MTLLPPPPPARKFPANRPALPGPSFQAPPRRPRALPLPPAPAKPETAEPVVGEAVIATPVIATPAARAPVPSANPGRDAKVVVLAEDDPDVRQLLVQSLGREYRVFEAADGQAVLELLARIARPAVVILDINMPRLDGLGVAAEIKGTPQLKDVPIIFLTCMDTAVDVVRGIQAGARNYITKPFTISKLMEKVAKATGQSN